MRQLGRTNAEFNLIEDKDRVLVGLSGGKDSLTMVHALTEHKRRTPFKFDVIAVTVDYGMGEDLDALIEHCHIHSIEHHVHRTEIYETAQEKIRENSSFCSFFSRMRRGSLYSAAQRFNCNKLALGHHLDDAAESFFMNLIYNGQLRTLPPKYRADNGVIVIRPLIQVRERQLAACALDNGWPTIGDEACPSMRFDVKMPHARAEMKKMLHEMEAKHPSLFVSVNAAFRNVSDDTFFDPERFKL